MFILNKNKHANFRHPDVGILPPSTAIEVDTKIANLLKNNINIIVFNHITMKEKQEEVVSEELKTHEDFLRESKGDMVKASIRWDTYKKEKGI